VNTILENYEYIKKSVDYYFRKFNIKNLEKEDMIQETCCELLNHFNFEQNINKSYINKVIKSKIYYLSNRIKKIKNKEHDYETRKI